MILKTGEIAVLLSITARHIQRLTKDKIIDNVERGKYNAAQTVKKYVDYQVELERRRNSIDDADLADAVKTEKIYDAKLKVLKYNQEIGRLVDKTAIEKAFYALIRTARDGILKIPDRVGDMLAAETEPTVVKKILKNEINILLEDFQTTGKN